MIIIDILIVLVLVILCGRIIISLIIGVGEILWPWLGPRKLVHSGWDDFPIKKGNHHEKNEKDSGANHPDLA